MPTHELTEAVDSAIPLELEVEPGVPIFVIHPAVPVATKLFAWSDRPERRKDAGDAAFLIREYENILDKRERFFQEHADLLQQDRFDLEEAYAEMLGRDTAMLLRKQSLNALRGLLTDETGSRETGRLSADMARRAGASKQKCHGLLASFASGVDA